MLRVSEPDLTSFERDALLDAFDSSFISGTGPYVEKSEELIREATGASYALLTCNGTASLHLSLMALGIGPGDEVIVPSFTYIASVNAILYVGATPVFVDTCLETWTLDPANLSGALSIRTRAIMAVHLYGHPYNQREIHRFAIEYGLKVIEDAAEAPFSSAFGVVAGNMADVASFSFFGNKVLTSGEGGAVTTNDPDLFERMKMLRNQGMDPKERFNHPMVGNNFRMNNLSAAILSVQLSRRSELLSRRDHVAKLYRRELDGIEGLEFQPLAEWATWTPWLFSVRIKSESGKNAGVLAKLLGENKIETRPFFRPAHLMEPYRKFSRQGEDFRNASMLSSSGMNLPTSSIMTETDVIRVAELIRAGLTE